MSYFRFYIYKAIRKVLFLPLFLWKGLIKAYFFVLDKTSILKIVFLRSERGNVIDSQH